jgi:signal transduction histidine kinase
MRNDQKKHSDANDELRGRAEERLAWTALSLSSKPSKAENQARLLHELQVHQVELELQNDALREARDKLEAANVELEAFNYSVSHDLRQPLTIINSYCQQIEILSGNQLNDESRAFVREIYESTQRMHCLIDAMLRFSKITHTQVFRKTVDLSNMAQEIAAGLALSTAGNPEFKTSPGIVADGDPVLLRSVLENLIGNAYKYAGHLPGAIIELGVDSADGTTTFFVRDNGPGFDLAFADKLFLPFMRLGKSATESYGIGLATAAKIVRLHGGQIWAESAPDQGATFFFTLGKENHS